MEGLEEHANQSNEGEPEEDIAGLAEAVQEVGLRFHSQSSTSQDSLVRRFKTFGRFTWAAAAARVRRSRRTSTTSSTSSQGLPSIR